MITTTDLETCNRANFQKPQLGGQVRSREGHAASLHLTECQEEALSILESNQNVHLSGAAGTGKSFLMQHFLSGEDKRTTAVLGSTGVAAMQLNGRTFHSFFQLGIMNDTPDAIVKRALHTATLRDRLCNTDTIVVDEISMLSAETLDVAERIAREARDCDKPWGGLRLVVTGDFYQLPPVVTKGSQLNWAFESDSWNIASFANVELKTIMRTVDKEFIEVLNIIREGTVNEQVRHFLDSRCGKVPDDLEATRLFAKREKVDEFNVRRVNALPGQTNLIPTGYWGRPSAIEQLKKSAPIGDELRIKKSALVMMRTNDVMGRWVNGSLGRVEDLGSNHLNVTLLDGRSVGIEKACFRQYGPDGEVIAQAENYPVTLAYASTIHKAQGATLDRAVVDLTKLWESGHAYTALSRVKSGSGLHIQDWEEKSIRVDMRVREFYGFTPPY
jgi:ATP-dependent DNA helicase PIF1